jgi:dynein regulatory complex protein 1
MATADKYTKGKDQLQKSRGNIEAKKRQTYEEITDVKLRNEKHEKDRRDLEEMQRHRRYTDLQTEAIESGKKNFALELKWSELRNIEECDTLFKEITKQKESFGEILNAKNRLIQRFKDDLRKKDDDYVKMLSQQKVDIDEILKKMREQFYSLRKMYLMELNDIETEFLADRDNILKDDDKQIDDLLLAHQRIEHSIVDLRAAKEEEYAKEIEKLRIDYAKSYADRKITMETEIQNLEKCLEDMKALYLLNSEKLDYNYKVLKEKDEENTHLTGILKNKRRNHYNRLRKAMKDYADIDYKFKNENKQLTEEYKRITRQFKELQNKFKHFEKADLDRYSEIQKMNESEVHEFKTKIMKCDKTIHIQQLGMQWTPTIPEESITMNETKEENMSKVQNSASGSINRGANQQGEEEFQFNIPPLEMEILTEILLRETDFLLDDKARANLETAKNLGDYRKMKLETIKKVLALDSVEEIDMLYKDLYRQVRISRNDKLLDEGEEEGEEEDYMPEDEPEIDYDPDLLVDSLIKFMSTQEQRKKELESIHAKKSITKETEREKKERIAREGKKYWEKLTFVLPEHTFRIWKILDRSLSKYYNLLLERQKLIEETGELHNQNEELKNLLNQYFQINHELIIPPTKMIQLEATQNSQ